ncbi:alpha/beta hydrolase [Streptomyces sp. NPDC048172]|uniref:alpha/beta hydrolase n=1 Tax=Streptomyces sp. NPDC048172 TaxID=3365505 RepID=UPI0037165B8C
MSALLPLTGFTHTYDGERLSGLEGGGGGDDGAGDGVPTVVLLHGAGNGTKDRLVPLLQDFLARGLHGLALDFSGHGASTGRLAELSLRRRYEQAAAVVEDRVPGTSPLVLVGFSMSGQTLADLAARFGPRVTALGLCSPAVYAEEAWDVPFGDGDGRFSEIIRRPDGWRDAPALAALRAFPGRAVLAVPGTDEVIPPAVTDAVAQALAENSRPLTRLEFPDAGHRLGEWFHTHPADRARFVTAVLGTA